MALENRAQWPVPSSHDARLLLGHSISPPTYAPPSTHTPSCLTSHRTPTPASSVEVIDLE